MADAPLTAVSAAQSQFWVWDVGTLAWVPGTQPGGSGGGGIVDQGTGGASAWLVTGNVGVTGSVSVTGTFWQATQPVSVASLPLPTGAATEATLSSIDATLTDVADTVNSAITAAHPVIDARAVLFAANALGVYGNIERTNGGNLKVAVEEFDTSLPAGTNSIGGVTTTETRPATATLSSVAGSASSVQLVAAAATRRGLAVFNDSTAVLYLKFGTTASTTSYTVQVPGGGYYEAPAPCYTGRVDGIWASATGNARITELT